MKSTCFLSVFEYFLFSFFFFFYSYLWSLLKSLLKDFVPPPGIHVDYDGVIKALAHEDSTNFAMNEGNPLKFLSRSLKKYKLNSIRVLQMLLPIFYNCVSFLLHFESLYHAKFLRKQFNILCQRFPDNDIFFITYHNNNVRD